MHFPILYSRNNTGSINQWEVILNGNSYIIRHGQVDGKLQDSLPQFASPKNVGKKNETNAEQQAVLEVEALYKKQRKSNYFDNIEDIDSGFLKPQLAKPSKDYLEKVDWSVGQILDDKLNGFACILTAKGAFTRTNEEYHSIPHIVEDYKEFFRDNPTAYIQGELFNRIYVNQLNKIAELIAVTRKPKDITPELLAESRRIVEFHWYDGYDFHAPSFGKVHQKTELKTRRFALEELIRANPYSFRFVRPVRYDIVFSLEDAQEKADAYILREGGEGKIIKNPKAPYQHKRTSDLLKLKKSETEEFTVISVEEGTGNWAGCAKFVWCELPNGTREKKFKSNIRGDQGHLRKVFQNRNYYPGKRIMVDFQEYSPYGTPLIPYTDVIVRNDIEGKIS